MSLSDLFCFLALVFTIVFLAKIVRPIIVAAQRSAFVVVSGFVHFHVVVIALESAVYPDVVSGLFGVDVDASSHSFC